MDKFLTPLDKFLTPLDKFLTPLDIVMETINALFERCRDYLADVAGNTWNWFGSLNREEWMVTLAIAAALGFLCMLGHSSRSA